MNIRALLARVEQRTGLTPAGAGSVVATMVLYVAGRAAASRGTVLLAYGGALFMVVAWLGGRRRPPLDAERSRLPNRLRPGQTVDVALVVTARRRTAAVVLHETLPGALGAPVRVPVAGLAAGASIGPAYRLAATRRGVYDVGPLVAEWSDPFGLTRRRAVLTRAARVIVHPALEPVADRVVSREWEDPPIRPPISKPWPTGFEFYGLRDYASGDDPRRIVWRATARTVGADGRPARYLVREAEQGITDRVNLFLDTDASSHSAGDPSETFEAAVAACASLGAVHLRDGFSVNLDTNAARLAVGFRGSARRIPFLDALAAVQPERVPFEKAVGRLLLLEPGRAAHNVVITPYLDQRTAAVLRLLRERGKSLLVVHVLWDGTDFASVHRAGSLGCNVVEVRAGAALDRQFQRVVGGARR